MGWTTHYDEVAPFAANVHSLVYGPGRQVDWAQVPDSFGGDAFTVTLDAAASVDDTSLTVEALEGDIPSGAVLYFDPDEFARVTEPAEEGDTTITVEALVTAIADGAEATWYPRQQGKVIPAGTIMAELSSGKLIPREAVTGSEEATHILAASAAEEDVAGSTGYGVLVGGAIYQNLLPDADHASFDTWIGELETAGVGIGWVWESYSDDTA
ncbi:MAG: hypothetical protein ACOC8X_03540 [Chloroflexota bacterium]